MKIKFVPICSQFVRAGICAALLLAVAGGSAGAATATIVDNVTSTVPGFTTVGANGAAQAFTGGGRAGALMVVTLKLRVSPNVGLDTFPVGSGSTVIQGKQVQVAIFDGASWVGLGGVILQRAFMGDTTFKDTFIANVGGAPLSSFSVGGSTTKIRVTGDGIDWAWGASANRAFSGADGMFGTARTIAAGGAETVLAGTTFQLSATRDSSADPVPPTITLFNPANAVNDPLRKAEGSGVNTPFVFTVRRTGDLSGSSSVSWAVSGATFFVPDAAVAGDFVGGAFPGGVLNFAANESAKDVTVMVNGDSDVEPDKGFRVRLSSPVSAVLDATSEAYGVINNDDSPGSLDLAATDADKAEGNSGATPFTFTVTRGGNVAVAATVNWAVTGGSGGPGTSTASEEDFVGNAFPAGTLNFAATETSKIITVNVAGDTVVESDKAFTVTLSNPSANAVIGVATANGLIRDDDVTVSLTPVQAVRSEGNSGVKPFRFTVQRYGAGGLALNRTTTVNWAVSGSANAPGVSAATAGDFAGNALTNGTVTFAPDQAFLGIDVLVAGNTNVQSDREFTVTLSGASVGANIITATAVGTIRDDDLNPAIIDTLPNQVSDTIDFFPAIAEHRDIAFTTDGQAYQLSSVELGFMVNDPAGVTVLVELKGDVGGAPGALLEGWTVSVPQGFSIVSNHSIATPMLSASTKYWLVVTPQVADPLALFSASLAAAPDSDNFGTGTLDGVNPLPFNPVLLPAVAVRGLSGASLVASLSLAATSATKPEGAPGSSTPFTFTITRSVVITNANSVDWAVSGSGARPANAADFVGGLLPHGTVNFAPGETSKLITVNVAGDNLAEQDETFTVTLTNASNGALIPGPTAVGTILGDDSELRLEVVNADRAEGAAGAWQFQVRRNGATNGITTVNWAVTGGPANPANAADFGGAFPAGTVTFNPGDTVQAIIINVADDFVVEPDETFTVTLASPSAGARIIVGVAGGIIRNDDTSVAIAALDADKLEGNGGSTPFTFLLTRSGLLTGATTVNYAVNGSGGNPAGANDFFGGALPAGTVTFNAGVAATVLAINVNGDTAVEPDEGFTVTISNPTAGATIGTATATGTIRNDEAPPGALIVSSFTNNPTGFFDAAVAPNSLAQSFRGGPQNLTLGSVALRLFSQTGGAVTTDIQLLADDAANNRPGTLLATLGTVQVTNTWSGNAMSAVELAQHEITVTVAVGVTIAANTKYWIGIQPTAPVMGSVGVDSWFDGVNDFSQGVGAMSMEIYDSNIPGIIPGGSFLEVRAVTALSAPTLAISAGNADQSEGNLGATAFTFNITRSGVLSGSTTVDWAVAGGAVNPASAADFQGGVFPNGSVTFGPGETSKSISVNVAGDPNLEADKEFVVTLSGATGGAPILAATARGVIRNDDTTLAIVATDADKPEGTGGATPFVFTITRSGRVDAAQAVNWAVTGSGAFPANAADFVGNALTNGTVNFAPGEFSKVIVVLVNADTDNERDETFTITLSGATGGAVITTPSATGTIRNDDPLAITAVGGNLQITWGVGATNGYVLESTDTLNPPNWVVVAPQVPDVGDGQASTILPLQGSGKFFRLRKLQ